MNMIIDTHCHLEKQYYDNIDEVIDRMKNNIIITSGVDYKTNVEVLEMCEKYDNVFGTLGYHPEEIEGFSLDSLKFLEDNINNPKIVAIGEIGLDYYYGKDDIEKQKEVFIVQLRLAAKYNKPVVVHSRDAIKDTYDILKEELKGNKCILHCYSSSLEMAKEFQKLGIKFGIGGVITFKNNKVLREVVEGLTLDNFILETDSPYLTPEPYRGHKNEPYNVNYVAKKIAELKNISIEEVISITTKTAISQFDLPI